MKHPDGGGADVRHVKGARRLMISRSGRRWHKAFNDAVDQGVTEQALRTLAKVMLPTTRIGQQGGRRWQ